MRIHPMPPYGTTQTPCHGPPSNRTLLAARREGTTMRFDEYRRHDATALAGLIAKGDVSAGEVLEAAIARAEQVNPAINAIVHKQYDQARRAAGAGAANGPFKGVPYLIKD